MTGILTSVAQAVSLTLVAVLAVATVLVREPIRQVMVSGLLGLSLVIAFAALMAPDVAIAEMAVSAIATPMVLLTIIYNTNGGGRG